MNARRKIRVGQFGKMALCCFALMAMSFQDVYAAEGWPITTISGVAKGVWMDNFAAATNLAYTTKTPMVLFWANVGCEYCEELENAINSPQFKAWQKAHADYIYNFVYASGGKDLPPNSNSGAKVFAQTAGGTMSALNLYPFVCLYWPKSDGTTYVTRLLGRAGYLNRAAYDANKSLAEEFAACIETHFAKYVPVEPAPEYTGGDLTFTAEYDNARLEAEVGYTKHVAVSFSRSPDAIGYAGTNVVNAVYAGRTILDKTLVWGEKQKVAAVAVAIPSDANAGEKICLSLYDVSGAVRGTVNIYLVAKRENSPKNPYFVGEKTVEELQYGEWTMDIDIAMAKYRADASSKLLALVGGSLWCPDCVMTDAHLLDRAEFREWAVANKVILVDIDIPNLPNTTNSPSLLTRIVSRASDSYISGRGTLSPDETQRYQSGAGYISRHMVTDSAAAGVIARNKALVGSNTLNGGWNSPDRANQNRTGVPIFVTLRRDGTLAGRIETFSATAPSEFMSAYLNRLDELLDIADDAASVKEESNASWQTTSEKFSGTGMSAATTLSAVDLIDTYELNALANGAAEQTIVVRGSDSDVTATVSLVQVVDGVVSTLATATGRFSDGISVSGVIAAGANYYVQVSGAASGKLAIDSDAVSTKAAYTLSGSRTQISNPYSNDWISKASTTMLPLYGTDSVSGKAIVGTLKVTLKKTKRVTATYTDGKNTIASFAGKWDVDKISADGTATLTLDKKGYELALRLKANGMINAIVSDGQYTFSSGECGLAESYGAFGGRYTVALPCLDDAGGILQSVGCPFAVLKMTTSSARKNGKFNYSIYLADGKILSGTTYITWLDANFGVVPLLSTSGRNTLAAAVKIRKNAGKAPSSRAVIIADNSAAQWVGSDGIRSYKYKLGVYGSYYDKNRSLVEQSGVNELVWLTDSVQSVFSDAYGSLLSVAGNGTKLRVSDKTIAASERSSKKNFSFSFNRTTGVFKGKTTLAFAEKNNVSASFSGVILPGWFTECDCGEDDDSLIQLNGLPFGLGYCVFSEKVNRKTVKRSFGVGLDAISE